MSLALTTTALGTLLPILRDNDMLGGVFGRHMFASGAVGELGPVLAISLFLSANGSWQSALAIATVVLVAWLIARMPSWLGARAWRDRVVDRPRTPPSRCCDGRSRCCSGLSC